MVPSPRPSPRKRGEGAVWHRLSSHPVAVAMPLFAGQLLAGRQRHGRLTTTKHGAERLDRLKRIYARLRRAAARLGIETEYWDALGQHRVADPEALARMIEALARAGGEHTDDLVP